MIRNSIFQNLQPPYSDPIFSLAQEFQRDPRLIKVYMGAGAYRDEDGQPYILKTVQKAEEIIKANPKQFDKEYPPMLGVPGFLRVSREFLLGKNHPAILNNQVATCQSVGGSGALHIAFSLLHQEFPCSLVYFPQETWVNHYSLYKKVYADVQYRSYAYVNPKTMKISFDQTVKDFEEAPEHSIFLLHACAHNPTGVDFNHEQWMVLLEIMIRRHLIPLIDNAYQGFASGCFDDDGWAIRLFSQQIECVIAQSFSKNFGLYGERVGACHVVHSGNLNLTARCNSAMALIVRSTWSITPIHGAYIVQVVGEHPELYAEFIKEISMMASRIKMMRALLFQQLQKLQTPGSWEHIIKSIGMFSYTNLTEKQVRYIRDKHAVYMVVAGGRACMCGITEKNVEYLANAINDTILNCKE